MSVYGDAFFPDNKIANGVQSFLCIDCPFFSRVPPQLLLLIGQNPIALPKPSEAFHFPAAEDARGSQLGSGRASSFCHTLHTPGNVVTIQRHPRSLNGVLEAKRQNLNI